MGAPSETVRLTQMADCQFDVDVGRGVPLLHADEPAPLGHGMPVHVNVFDLHGVRLK